MDETQIDEMLTDLQAFALSYTGPRPIQVAPAVYDRAMSDSAHEAIRNKIAPTATMRIP